MSRAPDYAHTAHARENRARKAAALAAAAAGLGLQVYEVKLVGGTVADRKRRAAVARAAGYSSASDETWAAALLELEALAWAVPGVEAHGPCGAPVLLEVTRGGKPVDLDPFPRERGTVWLSGDVVTGQRAVVLAGHDVPPVDVPLYRQHSRSCPATAHTRPSEGPWCEDCGQPLDGVLAARDPSYTSHPGCREGATL